MNIERMQKLMGVDDSEPELKHLFSLFFMPILLLMADQYGIEDTIYDDSGDEYRVTINLAMLNEGTTILIDNTDVDVMFHAFCKKYYEKDIEEIVNGPAKAFIGFNKDIIDKVTVSFTKSDNVDVNCIINEYNNSTDDFESKLVGLGHRAIFELSISVPKNELREVRALDNNKLFEYLSFLLYNWLIVSTQNHHWEVYHKHINKIISHMNELNERGEENESVENDTQKTEAPTKES